MTTFGDILFEPYVYVALLLIFIGLFYAKGNLKEAFFTSLPASLIIAPIWFVMLFVSLIVIIPAQKFMPSLYDAIALQHGTWPFAIQMLTFPASLLTITAFAFYCHYERKNRGLPSGYATSERTNCLNPFTRSFRK